MQRNRTRIKRGQQEQLTRKVMFSSVKCRTGDACHKHSCCPQHPSLPDRPVGFITHIATGGSESDLSSFPSSSITKLSDWLSPVLSSPTESQATHNLTWNHIVITWMAEPLGSHEVPQTLAHSSKQTHAPDTSSCCFFKTNLTWVFLPLLPISQSGPEIAELLNTQRKINETLSPPTSKQPPLILRAGLALRLCFWDPQLACRACSKSLSFLETYQPWKSLEMSP